MNILSLRSSIGGDTSVTRALSAAHLERLRATTPGAAVVERDLVSPAGKKAVVFVASGGVYSQGTGKAIDFPEPHLRWLFAFIGITDIELVRAEGLTYGADAAKATARDRAIALAA